MKFHDIIIFLFVIICNSCVETLTDEKTNYVLSNGGKKLELYLPKGISITKQTDSIDITRVEEFILSGYISGENLSLLRELSGGNDNVFLGGSYLNSINMEKLFFYKSLEVYYTRESTKLTVSSGNDIPSYAFENCYVLQKVVLPDMFTPYSINKGAFANCLLLKCIVWGKHVRSIGKEAFYNCSSLGINGKLELPEGLKTIENKAFENVHPNDVVLPSTIKNVGSYAFSSIIGNVYIYAEKPPSVEYDSFVFYKKSKRILFVPYSALTEYQKEPYISIFSSIQPIVEVN